MVIGLSGVQFGLLSFRVILNNKIGSEFVIKITSNDNRQDWTTRIEFLLPIYYKK